MFVDWLYETAEWASRGMPSKPAMIEHPWSTGNFTWIEAYQVHIHNLELRQEGSCSKRWRKSVILYNSNLFESQIVT